MDLGCVPGRTSPAMDWRCPSEMDSTLPSPPRDLPWIQGRTEQLEYRFQIHVGTAVGVSTGPVVGEADGGEESAGTNVSNCETNVGAIVELDVMFDPSDSNSLAAP